MFGGRIIRRNAESDNFRCLPEWLLSWMLVSVLQTMEKQWCWERVAAGKLPPPALRLTSKQGTDSDGGPSSPSMPSSGDCRAFMSSPENPIVSSASRAVSVGRNAGSPTAPSSLLVIRSANSIAGTNISPALRARALHFNGLYSSPTVSAGRCHIWHSM